MANYTLGADLSHYQLRPDMGLLEAAGVKFIIPKVSERMVIDPDFNWLVTEATKRNMLIGGGYAFIRPDDTTATVNNFIKTAGGIPLAIDDEAEGVTQQTIDMWVKGYEDGTGREGLGYYGLFPFSPISTSFKYWPHWFPQYPGSDSAPPRLPAWDGSAPVTDWTKQWLIWQYTGTARLPTVNNEQFDLNRLCCPLDVFSAWVKSGNGAWESGVVPFVPPTPSAPTKAPPSTLGSRDLYLHSTGDDVKEAQARLVASGAKLTVDGNFGPQTLAAVKVFQGQHSLTQDGWIGKLTAAELLKVV